MDLTAAVFFFSFSNTKKGPLFWARYTIENSLLRLILMRSDSELQIFMFRSEKIVGLLVRYDSAKSAGTKSDLRPRWPKSSDFGRRSDHSAHRIFKSKNGTRYLFLIRKK